MAIHLALGGALRNLSEILSPERDHPRDLRRQVGPREECGLGDPVRLEEKVHARLDLPVEEEGNKETGTPIWMVHQEAHTTEVNGLQAEVKKTIHHLYVMCYNFAEHARGSK